MTEASIFPWLEQVFASPESSYRWHRLYEALSENSDHQDYQSVVARLEGYIAPNPEARFLRATCLHALTGQLELLRAAADEAREIVPLRVERIHAFLLYTWSCAINLGAATSDFSSVLAAVDVAGLLRLVSRELEPYVEAKPRRPSVGKLRRVAVLTADARSIDNAATAMAVKSIGLLRAANLEAELFAMQEQDFIAMPAFLGTPTRLTTEKMDTDSWRPFVHGSLKAHIADSSLLLPFHRWRWGLLRLEAFEPDVVLFVGFFSPLPYIIYPTRPVAAISVHTVPPIVPADVWLAPKPGVAGPWRSPWSDTLPPGYAHSHPFRVFVKPFGRPINRSELKLPEAAVVLISVGARLASEIGRGWASLMLEILDRHRSVHWLLVGGTGAFPPTLAGGPAGRITTLAHHPEIRAICRCCDVFVNPRRMGGGFSVATAMAEGLAVVAYADSDGGDKVGELASPDDDAYFATLDGLIRQPELRRSQGAALRRRFYDELDIERGGASLVAGCEKAIEVFNERAPPC